MVASKAGYLDIVSFLLNSGADPSMTNKVSYLIIYTCTCRCNLYHVCCLYLCKLLSRDNVQHFIMLTIMNMRKLLIY